MDVFLIVALAVGGGCGVLLGIVYSIDTAMDVTQNTKDVISHWWWPIIYIMFGGFGLATAAFAIRRFSKTST
jgi:di/tricarboxylate transporter